MADTIDVRDLSDRDVEMLEKLVEFLREQAGKRSEEPALKEEEFILGSRASDVKGKLTRKEIYEDL